MGTDGDRRLTGPVRRAQPWQWAQGWWGGAPAQTATPDRRAVAFPCNAVAAKESIASYGS